MKIRLNKIVVSFFLFLALGALSTISGFVSAAAQSEEATQNSLFKQIEVIIFSKIQPSALLSEQWNMPTAIPDINQAIELAPFESVLELNQTPKELPSSYWKLNRISRRLSRNGYTILLHTAWVQDFSQAPLAPIHLFSPQELSSNLNTQMSGTINVTLNRYFNVVVDLLLGEPVAQLESLISPEVIQKNFHNVENGIAYFQLNQRRRMKSDELNYIDHPLYGMLIKITSFSN